MCYFTNFLHFIANKTTTWEYDAGGNILNRFEYEFTTIQDLSNLSPIVIPYAYAVTGIRDRLVEYNGKSFVYDEIGNPTLYQNNVLVWEKGRQLKSYGDIASYTYNASGIRTGKTVGTKTTEFFLDGTKILAQKDIVSAGENTTTETLMQFIYGVDGIIGFTLNNTNYYYKKNLQGDIIGIYDNNLQLITKYTYDAWGNHKISYLDNDIFVDFNPANSYNETNTSLYVALKNPFRYRSYYYDTETGLYYLNSRYYDPEIGRFINIDDIEILDTTKDFANGINLYAYCLNNPVNDTDSNGNLSWWQWLLVGIGAVFVVAATAVLTVASGGTALGVIGTIAVGAAKGALIGAAVGTTLGAIGGGIYSAVTGADFWSSVAAGAAMGFGIGAVVGAVIGASVAGIQVVNAAKMWAKGTFNSGYQSMKYHFGKHVISEGIKGKNIVQYTKNAVQFFSQNKNIAIWKTYPTPLKQPGWLINNDLGKGLYDTFQKIIYFLYK